MINKSLHNMKFQNYTFRNHKKIIIFNENSRVYRIVAFLAFFYPYSKFEKCGFKFLISDHDYFGVRRSVSETYQSVIHLLSEDALHLIAI